MPRYYFNIREGAHLTPDPHEFGCFSIAREGALIDARQIMTDRMQSGRCIDAVAVEIADENHTLETIPLRTLLEI